MLFLCACAYAQDSVKAVKPAKAYNYKPLGNNPNFPFIVSLPTIEYDITINLADPKITDKYSTLFKNSNVPFTPESWEALISDLYNDDSEMHHQIITSAQRDVLRIGTGGEEYQKTFLKYMLPIFSDMERLEVFLKKDDE
jgi:hypothetical protein